MKEDITVSCCLCGSECSFDGRDGYKILGTLTAWFGFFLLPLGTIALMAELTGWDESVGIVAGLILWAVLTTTFFSRRPRWVCSQCGACFPAIRPDDEDDTKE